jgi:cell division protein FtsB
LERFLQPRWFLSAAAILVSFLVLLNAIFGNHGYLEVRKQQRVYQEMEQARDRARAEQQRIRKENRELQSADGVERVAREEIKLAKPGEIVITLPEGGNVTTPAPGTGKTPKPPEKKPGKPQ